MRKPKSKAKQKTIQKKAAKRLERFKDSRKKVVRKREIALERKRAEKKKYEEFMKKMIDARMKGEL